MTNQDRVNSADRAIEAAFDDGDHDNHAEQFIDLLTNLLHYAEYYELEFEFCLSVARKHFEAERHDTD